MFVPVFTNVGLTRATRAAVSRWRAVWQSWETVHLASCGGRSLSGSNGGSCRSVGDGRVRFVIATTTDSSYLHPQGGPHLITVTEGKRPRRQPSLPTGLARCRTVHPRCNDNLKIPLTPSAAVDGIDPGQIGDSGSCADQLNPCAWRHSIPSAMPVPERPRDNAFNAG